MGCVCEVDSWRADDSDMKKCHKSMLLNLEVFSKAGKWRIFGKRQSFICYKISWKKEEFILGKTVFPYSVVFERTIVTNFWLKCRILHSIDFENYIIDYECILQKWQKISKWAKLVKNDYVLLTFFLFPREVLS